MASLVDEFNVKEDLARKGMVGGDDLSKVDERVDSSKECTIEPSSTLGDEFGNRI